ncbi:MAG: hypothetical protein ACYYK0_01540 [Candidatus Eutrophobiaceae bacterium]
MTRWRWRVMARGRVVDADAQNNLGVMYYEGRGVLQDDKMAVQVPRAAEQGWAFPAQTNLDEATRGEACRRMTRWRRSGGSRRRVGICRCPKQSGSTYGAARHAAG